MKKIAFLIAVLFLMQACSSEYQDKTHSLTGNPDYRATGKLEERVASPANFPGTTYDASAERKVASRRLNYPGGILTAAEWNPFRRFSAWKEQQNTIYAGMKATWNLPSLQFYNIKITDAGNHPVPGCKVALVNDKQMLKSTLSDNAGRARLAVDVAMLSRYQNAEIQVFYKEKAYATFPASDRSLNLRHAKLPLQTQKNCTADILFVVDATGSMGDEIQFLKNELSDVIQRVQRQNSNTDYRLGALFYRDKSEEYLLNPSEFSSEIGRTISFIDQQSAHGGGDYPEAVHTALDEAVFEMNWRENAGARILFLMLDAPPHKSKTVNRSLKKSIDKAAQMGIRIIPVTASGIDRETEFLMKSFAMMTNGTYTFITDHSGVGDKHLSPAADNYRVEKLNDMMVRLINEYSGSEYCGRKLPAANMEHPAIAAPLHLGFSNMLSGWQESRKIAGGLLFFCFLYAADRVYFW